MNVEKGTPRPEIVVSLTSFPGAIDYAAGAVESILSGTVLPDRIVLYVTRSEFGDQSLPSGLLQLEASCEIFEIRDYPENIRSYRKLIPALADFPNAIIVTIDDDADYHPKMLERLLDLHHCFPNHVLAHRAKRLKVDVPYKKWSKYRWYHFLSCRFYDRVDTIQTGVGGVLYPPGALRADMLDTEKVTKLAPTADDIMFWAAAVANGRRVMPVPFGYNKPRGLGKPRELSLKTVNFKSGKDRNLKSLQAILDEYPEIRKIIGDETRKSN